MITAADIKKMTPPERLQTIELLWDSLIDSPEEVETPAWHREVLKERTALIKTGKEKFYTLEEVKKRLARKRA